MKKHKNWYQEAVFYELNIRAFADSTSDGNGDFLGAIQKLDHIKTTMHDLKQLQQTDQG